jgi:hypothetical protein
LLFDSVLSELVCRAYAILPFVVTPLLAGIIAGTGWGAAVAALATLGALATLVWNSRLLPNRRVGLTRAVANAVVYYLVVAASGLPFRDQPLNWLLGWCAGLAVQIIVGSIPPGWQPRWFQPDLVPDALTSLILVALFGVPVACIRRVGHWRQPAPPYRISVIVTSYDEEDTVVDSLTSLGESVARAKPNRHVSSIRLVLADSSSRDRTRDRAAPLVDAILDCPLGKLNARDYAFRAEDCDVIMVADADRLYPPDWLSQLLQKLEVGGTVAVTGETRIAGHDLNGSALAREALKMPFNGGSAGFFKSAYLQARHNLAIDQFKHRSLWREEEFLFGLRLRRLGRVAYVAQGVCLEMRPYSLLQLMMRHLFSVRLKTF